MGIIKMREIFGRSSLPTLKLPNSRTFLFLLYTTTLFLCFLILTFPHDLLLRRLEGNLSQNTAVHLTYTQGRFAGWQGYELRDVALHTAPWSTPMLSKAEGSDSTLPLLSFSRFFVRPRLHRLILGQLFPLRVHGELYGGRFAGEFWWQEPAVRGSLRLHRIDLSRYRFPSLLTEASVHGLMSVEASFSGQASKRQTHRGEITAILEDGEVAGGQLRDFSLPQLRFSQIRLRGRLEKDRVEVQEFVAQLDGLEVQGQGQIRLRAPLSRSLLDLRFSLEPNDSLPPALRPLLALLPSSSGSPENRTLAVSGTVGHPLLR